MKFETYDNEVFQKLYTNLETNQNLLSEYASLDKYAKRRHKEKFHVSRPNYVKDVERIIHSRFYNRYSDKTQVFSLYKNDDISRRALHVQIVSRIARNIGRMLNLNTDLIEAIALGHDLGHTPFGHLGETMLNNLYYENTGRYFKHNVQSVRILDKMLKLNISLQTLDGILCHNGEKLCKEYKPTYNELDFTHMENRINKLYTEKNCKFISSTLEGCVVRISDIIAYIGKDRQDAEILDIKAKFADNDVIGGSNSEFIGNIIANLVSLSYGKDYLSLDERYYTAIDTEKALNQKIIYDLQNEIAQDVKNMFDRLYSKFLKDLKEGRSRSHIFKHHINKLFGSYSDGAEKTEEYMEEEKNQIVVDYIASMTDDYFIDIFDYLYPNSTNLKYKSYF